jgi:hypothetical protein
VLRFGRIVLTAAILAGMIGPAQAALAAAKPDVVLINQPAGSVCVGKTFTVGVWYQQSGGSGAYRINVHNPRGARVLSKHGVAPSSNWLFWKVRAKLAGEYRTVYWTHPPGSRRWARYRALTMARRC